MGDNVFKHLIEIKNIACMYLKYGMLNVCEKIGFDDVMHTYVH